MDIGNPFYENFLGIDWIDYVQGQTTKKKEYTEYSNQRHSLPAFSGFHCLPPSSRCLKELRVMPLCTFSPTAGAVTSVLRGIVTDLSRLFVHSVPRFLHPELLIEEQGCRPDVLRDHPCGAFPFSPDIPHGQLLYPLDPIGSDPGLAPKAHGIQPLFFPDQAVFLFRDGDDGGYLRFPGNGAMEHIAGRCGKGRASGIRNSPDPRSGPSGNQKRAGNYPDRLQEMRLSFRSGWRVLKRPAREPWSVRKGA